VRLTPAGRIFYEKVRHILRDIDQAVTLAHAAKRGEAGRLRLALNEGASQNTTVTQGLRAFRKRYPDIHVELFSSLTDEQLVLLQKEEVDAGFLYEFPTDIQSSVPLDSKELFTEPLILAIQKDHPLNQRPRIFLKDLADENWIWPARRHGGRLRDRMTAVCHAAGMSPKVIMEGVTVDTTLHMASTGLAMGFVTKTGREPDGVALRKVEDFDVPLSMRLVWRRGETLPALLRLIAIFS
jgi:DNA-binding transcriptional LysR family regulator